LRGLLLRWASPGTAGTVECQPTSATTLALGLCPDALVPDAMPESPECRCFFSLSLGRYSAGSVSSSVTSSRRAPSPRLRTELALMLVLLTPRACIDGQACPRLWRERSSSVQSLYSSSSSRWRASSRSSRSASSRADEAERSWTARGRIAGCSGVETGVRR